MKNPFVMNDRVILTCSCHNGQLATVENVANNYCAVLIDGRKDSMQAHFRILRHVEGGAMEECP